MTSHRPGDPDRPANQLAGQTSPYLIQHVHNPVDWHPWGPAALDRARREDRPVFVSIGYAACHWCHVMERESFEDDEVAELLNRHFVSSKIDREDRPDLDEIYMSAVQLMTGQGGWPLNVFLTPDLRPFVGGTYFPPDDRYGRMGFKQVLGRIIEAWGSRRAEIDRAAGELTEQIRRIGRGLIDERARRIPGRGDMARAAAELAGRFDSTWGGFGGAPKFPPDSALALLLREHHRSGERMPLRMTELTLDRMALGGLYDHVGGGFARYSVDERWLVPHFEKMLYNQALLVPNYVDAWLLTGKPLYRRVVEQTLDFVRRELTGPEGGCWSSLDADSEGEEGRFYVWTPDEVRAELGDADGSLFCEVYGITAGGNFEGASIPNLLGGSLTEQAERRGTTEPALWRQLDPLRRKLLAARGRRVRPGTDDKVLTAWNGLMITAFARAWQALGRPEDLDSSRRAAGFVLDNLERDGRLLVSWRAGQARLGAYLDDHAFLARGLVDLYEACFERAWLDRAAGLARTLLEHFEDREHGGFFFTADDHEPLLSRNRSTHDGALPSGLGVGTETLLRLALLTGETRFRDAAGRALECAGPAVQQAPGAYASSLAAADLLHGPVHEIALVGNAGTAELDALLRVVRGRYLPARVVALAKPGEAGEPLPLLRGKEPLDGRPAAYVCRDYACREPTSDPERLARLLDEAERPEAER